MAPPTLKRSESPRRHTKRRASSAKGSARSSKNASNVVAPKAPHRTFKSFRQTGILSKFQTYEQLQRVSKDDSTFVMPMVHLGEGVEQFFIDNLEPLHLVSRTSSAKLSRLSTIEILHESASRLNIVKSRRFFDKIRELAVEHLANDMLRKLTIIGENVACVPHKDLSVDEPYNVFGWTWQDFWLRCQGQNNLWIEHMLLNKVSDLGIYKFECDIRELQKMLRLFFEGFTSTAPFAKEEVHEAVRDAQEYIEIYNILVNECGKVLVRLQQDVNLFLERQVAHKLEGAAAHRKAFLEDQISEANVFYPIELRYQLKWIDAKVAQAELRKNMEITAYDKKVEACHEEVEKENYISKSVAETFLGQIEDYTERISQFNAKYEYEFDKLDGEITMMKSTIEKMHTQRGFLEEQMERFREDIELMRLQMIEDEEKDKRNSVAKKVVQQPRKVKSKQAKKKKK